MNTMVTALCLVCGEDVIGDRCSACRSAHPGHLEMDAEYRLVSSRHGRDVPVMPWLEPPAWFRPLPYAAAMLALRTRVTYLKAGNLFIPEDRVDDEDGWMPVYRVWASGPGFMAQGWLNSVALMGWSVERV